MICVLIYIYILNSNDKSIKRVFKNYYLQDTYIKFKPNQGTVST